MSLGKKSSFFMLVGSARLKKQAVSITAAFVKDVPSSRGRFMAI